MTGRESLWLLMTSLFLLASVLLSSNALAQKTAAGVMEKLDRDGDGRVSRQEWRKKRIFKRVDLDDDGFVSFEELQIRFGEKIPGADGQVEMPDRVSMSAIRRAGFDDVQDLKDRGLIETGLRPVWPEGVECRGIDEWYAKDYSNKRPKEAYHGGIDIPAPFGTPIHAAMDGEVVALYEGKHNARGIEVVLRHTPEDSGLPLYLYTRYTHFDRMPDVRVGQRLKMGDVIGPTGNSGVQGCELIGKDCRRTRRPAIHFDVLYSKNAKYLDTGGVLVPFEAHWMDPNALYRKRPPFDSQNLRALPEAQKAILISYMLDSGERFPPDTRMIWPYTCSRRSAEKDQEGIIPWH
jgi:murein DD-endopeptidase MepM/ murein hydrolase activator NlpD